MSPRRRLGRITAAGLVTVTAPTLDMVVDPASGAVRLADRNSVSHAERIWSTSTNPNDVPREIRNFAGGVTRCLATADGSDRSLVFAAPCDGSPGQQWTVKFVGDGSGERRIKNVAFGTVVAAVLDGPAANSVFTAPPADSKGEAIKQRWKLDS
jgi:hypothetical protein